MSTAAPARQQVSDFIASQGLVLAAYEPMGERSAVPKVGSRWRSADEFMVAMKTRATTAGHINGSMHALGHFKRRLDKWSRDELLMLIEDYR